MGLFTTLAGVFTGGKKVVNAVSGGGKESQADLDKQEIQDQLASLGYPEFSRMSGWGGDEKAKRNAVSLILDAVTADPAAGSQIVGYLEGGKVTPGTIEKVKAASFGIGSGGKDPVKKVPLIGATKASAMGSGGSAVNMPLYILGGLLLLGSGLIYFFGIREA